MLILSVVGARPQFMKAAPFSRAIREVCTEYLVHTGQHYDSQMSAVFFEELGIPEPDMNLGIGSASHARQTGEMMIALEDVMLDQKPDWVVVYGDTNSTLAAALSAAKLHIPIAHIEAGLRSYNRDMPEEINRVMTDHLSTLLFCPTQIAQENLAKEGLIDGVVVTGDIMVDSVLQNVDRAHAKSTIGDSLPIDLHAPYILTTIHRPANTDNPAILRDILENLNQLSYPVVFPVHPRTRTAINAIDYTPASHVHLIEPVGYLDMIYLLDGAATILTDSGGLQKEAYILRTPCVTLRTETEWVETVSSGWNRLSTPAALQTNINLAMTTQPPEHPAFYGDGRAASQMVNCLRNSG